MNIWCRWATICIEEFTYISTEERIAYFNIEYPDSIKGFEKNKEYEHGYSVFIKSYAFCIDFESGMKILQGKYRKGYKS